MQHDVTVTIEMFTRRMLCATAILEVNYYDFSPRDIVVLNYILNH